MIDGTENPKIPSKFAKRTARYNEFRYNIPKMEPNFLCKVFSPRTNIPHVVPGQNIRIVQAHFTFFQF